MNQQTNPASPLARIVQSQRFQNFILGLIIVNAVILGMETSPSIMARHGGLLHLLDSIILGIFVLEIAARLVVHRLAFFRDPWSLFDLFVVGIALVPASGDLAVLRAFRVLRVLRVITMLQSMRRVVSALLSAIPGLNAIVVLISLVFYVFAVMATHLYGAQFPEWFGSLGRSMYTLFQVMTLESWSMGIVRPVMEQQPMAWLFFVPFILVTSFTVLNLFIAVIVNAMQSAASAEHEDAMHAVAAAEEQLHTELKEEMSRLHREIGELRHLLEQQRSPNRDDS